MNLSTVSQIVNDVNPMIISALEESSDCETFENKYFSKVKALFSKYNLSKEEYFCVRVYADVYMNSFQTWASYKYKKENKLCGYGTMFTDLWGDIKRGCKDIWREIKPLVKADAKGCCKRCFVSSGNNRGSGCSRNGFRLRMY